MAKTPKENLEIIEKWLGEISKTNDANVSQTDNLNIVLVNLKLEDARIKDDTGIIPIAEEIERVIKNIHDNTDDLKKTGRAELRQAFREIKEFVLENVLEDEA